MAVYSITVGFSPKLYTLLTLSDNIGEPFYYHVELLSIQPVFPPNLLIVDCSGGLAAFRFFLNNDDNIVRPGSYGCSHSKCSQLNVFLVIGNIRGPTVDLFILHDKSLKNVEYEVVYK